VSTTTAKLHKDPEALRTTLDQWVGPPSIPPGDLDRAADPGAGAEDLWREIERRYEPRATLGEGGMGEVLLCIDRRMGREVAMKVVHPSRADAPDVRARFLREARVQGRLEHPAIVPVHDLAQDADGRAFFTMKRVRGETLETVIGRLAAGDASAAVEYTRHRLLAAFARVCLAIDFAHARGVVHRDLKPANVMLGDFGEVYVLDWGVAKVRFDVRDDTADELSPAVSGERSTVGASTCTEDGVVLGTPAYMAPEHRRGSPVDARTDVYALGAILYELLTFSSFHERRASGPFSVVTEAGLPPELFAICCRATAPSPSDRHASARELHDAVERFLSGDRDLATRRVLVASHLEAARAHRALRPPTLASRSRALAEVGRAIALDPNDAEALRILVELVSEEPETPPAEVAEEIERADDLSRANGVKRAVLFYTAPVFLFFVPAALLMEPKSIGLVGLCIGAYLLTAVATALSSSRRRFTAHVPWVTLASSLAIACTSVFFGVFVLVPTLVVGNTICHAVTVRERQRPAVIAIGALALLVPLVLELVGVGPNHHSFVNGTLVLSSQVFDFHPIKTPIFLMVANIGMLVFASMYVSHYKNALARSELRNVSQLWQLRQLVPESARSATSRPPPEAPCAVVSLASRASRAGCRATSRSRRGDRRPPA
jgi:serine/threonine-protein kinase